MKYERRVVYDPAYPFKRLPIGLVAELGPRLHKQLIRPRLAFIPQQADPVLAVEKVLIPERSTFEEVVVDRLDKNVVVLGLNIRREVPNQHRRQKDHGGDSRRRAEPKSPRNAHNRPSASA